MKRFFVIVVFCISAVGFINAQDAVTLKNEGNDALRSKKYAEALEKFEKSLAAWDDSDADNQMIYNTGYCAFKTKNYNKAIKYFNQSISAGYKAENAIRYKAFSYSKLSDTDSYLKTLEEGINKYPNSKSIKTDLTKFYNKKALKHYNKGAEILKAAATDVSAGKYKTTDDAYLAEIDKAKKEFKAAIPFLDKAQKYSPNDATAKKIRKGCEDNLKM